MNLYIRLIIKLFVAWFSAPLSDVLSPSAQRFHVLPNDLDLNGHMNNGRYLTIMDLGRLDFIIRMGLAKAMLRGKWGPVLSAVKIRYRLPLFAFQAYDLETRVLCWDDKWVYMEQRFIISKGRKAGAVAAIALLKGGFYDAETKTTVPTQTIMDAANINTKSPPVPSYVQSWIEAEDKLREVTAAVST